MVNKILFGLIFFFGLTSKLVAAPILQVDSSNRLIGIEGIFIDSGSFRETYDVSFQDGSCIELFTGCERNSEDLFPINLRLRAANTELLAALGSFSDSPELIRGCQSLAECIIVSPGNINTAGGGSVGGWSLQIQAGPGNDSLLFVQGTRREEDFRAIDNRTYAVWTPSAVPVPAAIWLFGSGLLGLIAIARRSNTR